MNGRRLFSYGIYVGWLGRLGARQLEYLYFESNISQS